ncbi:Protein N-acetyltransferase, RimJ/RimL family [Tenacibaculum sp. MAR_2009_124]|uniref:GNAT family N-acetyltransferase n=1 Tax=Tenacibaculum sp. MAR_2009_124 TaxID=1250059 RepID=UPI000894D4AC|nr:GNAT family N-acetyltransferase [Tenacibaculum sp. MAR_2009_124]SEC51949.1 Protein N-acetyltransferase, RimJ/RimL family [Tenacibaculum sp. MAR_2009_124]
MKSQSILLRPLQISDAAEITVLLNNKNIWDHLRNYIPFPYTEKDAKDFINMIHKEDLLQNFVIEYNGKLSGVIGLTLQKDIYTNSAELGYWLGEPFWGKGIMTQAIKLMIEIGFSKLDLRRIYAGVFAFNIGSMKALEKNGFEKEGVFKHAVIKNEKVYDEHRFYKLNPRVV